MSVLATRHKLIKKIKDEKFTEEKLQQYVLLVQIGAKDLQTAVLDSEDNRLLYFEDYVFHDVNSAEDLLASMKALFDAHEHITAGFWKEVKISVKNTKFIQVPVSLFIEDAAQEYLSFNAALEDEKETIKFCRPVHTGAVTIFTVQTEMLKWLDNIYANTRYSLYHQSAALMEGVMSSSGIRNSDPLYVYVDRFKLHVLYFSKGKPVYYNQFLIKQFNDYVKYIMLVMKTMGIDQETGQVVLWGYIGKNSPHYQEFTRFVRNISFGERPDHIRFGHDFDEIQGHHYFDLYSINLLGA